MILVLFDIDGTLLKCQGRGMRAMHRSVQLVFGLEPVESTVRPHGKTDPMLFDELADVYGLERAVVGAHQPELRSVYEKELKTLLAEPGSCKLEPGVASILEALAGARDVVTGVVTGNLEKTAWLKLQAGGIASYFSFGAFGSDARNRNDLVRIALQRFEARHGTTIDPDGIWVVGDTPDDVTSGQAHGTRTLAVATGTFPREVLERAQPDIVFDDLSDSEAVLDVLCPPR